ncbi:hypothetical protein B9S64_28245 [Streptomyces sp. SM18]|nr:hypothetical protein B9S64_28245 [Streptomyces sp. SM18]
MRSGRWKRSPRSRRTTWCRASWWRWPSDEAARGLWHGGRSPLPRQARPPGPPETVCRTRPAAATFPVAVRETEEVVPVNAVSTWVLPSGVTVGR